MKLKLLIILMLWMGLSACEEKVIELTKYLPLESPIENQGEQPKEEVPGEDDTEEDDVEENGDTEEGERDINQNSPTDIIIPQIPINSSPLEELPEANENSDINPVGGSSGAENPALRVVYDFDQAKVLISPLMSSDQIILQKITNEGDYEDAIYIEGEIENRFSKPEVRFVKHYRDDIFYVVYKRKFIASEGATPCLFYEVIDDDLVNCVDEEVEFISSSDEVHINDFGHLVYKARFSVPNQLLPCPERENDEFDFFDDGCSSYWFRYKSDEVKIDINSPFQSIFTYLPTSDGKFYMEGRDQGRDLFFRRWELNENNQARVHSIFGEENRGNIGTLYETNDNRIIFSGGVRPMIHEEEDGPFGEDPGEVEGLENLEEVVVENHDIENNQGEIIQPVDRFGRSHYGMFEIDVLDNQFQIEIILTQDQNQGIHRRCLGGYYGDFIENDQGLFFFFTLGSDQFVGDRQASDLYLLQLDEDNQRCIEVSAGAVIDIKKGRNKIYFFEDTNQNWQLFELELEQEIVKRLIFDENIQNTQIVGEYYIDSDDFIYFQGMSLPENEFSFFKIDLNNNYELSINDEVFENEIEIFIPINRN